MAECKIKLFELGKKSYAFLTLKGKAQCVIKTCSGAKGVSRFKNIIFLKKTETWPER